MHVQLAPLTPRSVLYYIKQVCSRQETTTLSQRHRDNLTTSISQSIRVQQHGVGTGREVDRRR